MHIVLQLYMYDFVNLLNNKILLKTKIMIE